MNKPKWRVKNPRTYLLWLAALAAVIIGGLFWTNHDRLSNNQSSLSSPGASFNKNQFPINDAASLWAIVNKGRALPTDYVPANLVVSSVPLRLSANDPEMHLRRESAEALEIFFKAAEQQNLHLMLASGYRSYSWQTEVYNYFVKVQGQAKADASSARPGHSEHQTGLAADIEPADRRCEVDSCFAQTAEGRWLAANAYKYGFLIRYQAGKQGLTGYDYEPWHIRFVGRNLAEKLQPSGLTMEQFFGLPAYTAYPSNSYILKE